MGHETRSHRNHEFGVKKGVLFRNNNNNGNFNINNNNKTICESDSTKRHNRWAWSKRQKEKRNKIESSSQEILASSRFEKSTKLGKCSEMNRQLSCGGQDPCQCWNGDDSCADSCANMACSCDKECLCGNQTVCCESNCDSGNQVPCNCDGGIEDCDHGLSDSYCKVDGSECGREVTSTAKLTETEDTSL